jgi:nitric oxide reductase subunit C
MEAGANPITLGEALSRSVTPSCTACHRPGVDMAGPSLARLGTRARKIIQSPK